MGVAVRPGVRFEPPLEDGIGRIVLDRADDAINAIDTDLVESLAEAVRSARSCDGLCGLVIASPKPGQWVAGADLKMVTQATDAQQVEAVARHFQAVLDELAWLPCTSVAAINGAALGGGLELALACDYRVAADAPSVSLGQPEVNLGLVPAGGGTQRLPRLIGLERALDLILTGRRLNARRALRARLLDEVVHPSVLEQAARRWAARPKRPLDRPLALGINRRAALDLAEQTPVGRQVIYAQARKAVLERTRGLYPAPLRALEAVELGLEKGVAAGLEAEARALGELAVTETVRNLIWLFLATQRQKRSSSRKLSRLGVVGAGFMGAAIAEVGAASGMAVRVRDVKPEAVAHGLASIRQMVDEGVAHRRFEPRQGRDILQRVSAATDYSGFARAEVVIEAVFEDVTLKRQVIDQLEAVVPSDTVLASNTSAIPIRDLALRAKHPERVVGMHFFSPAQRMPLVEVVRPAGAADWAVEAAVAAATQMGKTVVVVADAPGFYTSRVLGVMLNEAALLLGEGARIEDVDRAMMAFGFPVGPFVLYDEVGLQVALHAGESVARAFGDRIPPAHVVADLVSAGQTGRKAGAGFYLWRKPSRLPGFVTRRPSRTPNRAAYGGTARKTFDGSAIQDRLALLFVNEAVRCLDEDVLRSPAEGDLAAVLGLGFPPFLGGPFHYADALGAQALAKRLLALAATHGSRYEPARSIVDGRTFFEE